MELASKETKQKEEEEEEKRRIGTIPLTGAHIPHREGPEGKGCCTGARPSVCVSVGPGNPLLARLPPKQGRQDPRRERVGGEGQSGQRWGPVRSLYFKQPRTCCNHLETMAHRSVRLAKRPGPDNSRDASSTTLRAILLLLLHLLHSIASPSAVLFLSFFSPPGEFLLPPSRERERERGRGVEIDTILAIVH